MHPKIRHVYDSQPAPKSCFLFAVFTFKIELGIVLKLKRWEYHETKQKKIGSFKDGSNNFCLNFYPKTWLQARSVTKNFKKHTIGEFFFFVLDTKLDSNLPTLILFPLKSFKPYTKGKKKWPRSTYCSMIRRCIHQIWNRSLWWLSLWVPSNRSCCGMSMPPSRQS